jgi:hypothetical protein
MPVKTKAFFEPIYRNFQLRKLPYIMWPKNALIKRVNPLNLNPVFSAVEKLSTGFL